MLHSEHSISLSEFQKKRKYYSMIISNAFLEEVGKFVVENDCSWMVFGHSQ